MRITCVFQPEIVYFFQSQGRNGSFFRQKFNYNVRLGCNALKLVHYSESIRRDNTCNAVYAVIVVS